MPDAIDPRINLLPLTEPHKEDFTAAVRIVLANPGAFAETARRLDAEYSVETYRRRHAGEWEALRRMDERILSSAPTVAEVLGRSHTSQSSWRSREGNPEEIYFDKELDEKRREEARKADPAAYERLMEQRAKELATLEAERRDGRAVSRVERLRLALEELAEAEMEIGVETEAHARKVILVAYLLVWHETRDDLGEFGRWEWDGSPVRLLAVSAEEAQRLNALPPGRDRVLFLWFGFDKRQVDPTLEGALLRFMAKVKDAIPLVPTPTETPKGGFVEKVYEFLRLAGETINTTEPGHRREAIDGLWAAHSPGISSARGNLTDPQNPEVLNIVNQVEALITATVDTPKGGDEKWWEQWRDMNAATHRSQGAIGEKPLTSGGIVTLTQDGGEMLDPADTPATLYRWIRAREFWFNDRNTGWNEADATRILHDAMFYARHIIETTPTLPALPYQTANKGTDLANLQTWAQCAAEVMTAAGRDESPKGAAAAAARAQVPALKEPGPAAFKAYRACRGLGKPQTEVAGMLKTNQGQISKWVGEVTEWLEAGNILPDISGLAAQPVSVDPGTIEMGERQDHRTRRQRERAENNEE